MNVEREQWLKELESVIPGLSNREIIEQSKCFVFKNKKVVTYNDEVACFQDSCVDIQGAVQSEKLLLLLRKLSVPTLIVDVVKGSLQIRAKGRRRAEIPLEAEIVLPIDSIKQPKQWIDLPSDFLDAVNLVRDCVGKDESVFHLTCVHLHPEWIEACDNFQAARYVLKTGLEKSILVRKDSLRYVTSLGMNQFGCTKNWIHFKNPNGLILSCRLYREEYPDLKDILTVKGTRTSLPKGLDRAVECASIFSKADVDENHVTLTLAAGEVRIVGQSVGGKYTEKQKIEYDKDPMTFTITPNLLLQVLSKYNSCVISRKTNRLKAGLGSKFTYVTVLGANKEQASDDARESNTSE